jgi:hypothetical protein
MNNGDDMISCVTDDDAYNDFNKLDLSGLKFPSDAISVGAIRKLHPELFDIGYVYAHEEEQPKFFFQPTRAYHSDSIGEMIQMERFIATTAYAKSAGIPPPPPPDYEMEEELARLYVHFGVASGKHVADELIRDVEKQGAALGQQRQL